MVEKFEKICGKDCTACNACINICPKDCISYEMDFTGTKYAIINKNKCILCNLCKKVCPQLNYVEDNFPKHCYAAWSHNIEIRKKSASGGIATELYKMFEAEEGLFSGVKLTDSFSAEYQLADKLDVIKDYQNSKYVYSDTKMIYQSIGNLLKQGKRILFIGLPCHVAAIKQYVKIKKIVDDKLFTVDLICHGVTPSEFLKEHIAYIEKSYNEKATKLYFRDPDNHTYTYTFSLQNEKGTFYRRKVHRNDMYQIGYHYGITYRSNCYKCRYAQPKRVGDITLADFGYVGTYASCEYDNKNVSCILINTEKGKRLIEDLNKTGNIFVEERPMEEEIETEKQLKYPTVSPKERKKFLKLLLKTGNFEISMKGAARIIILKNEIKYYFHIDEIYSKISHMLPKAFKASVKKLIGGSKKLLK